MKERRDRAADRDVDLWERLSQELPTIIDRHSDEEIARLIEEQFGISSTAILAAFRTQDGGESSLEAVWRAYEASRVD